MVTRRLLLFLTFRRREEKRFDSFGSLAFEPRVFSNMTVSPSFLFSHRMSISSHRDLASRVGSASAEACKWALDKSVFSTRALDHRRAARRRNRKKSIREPRFPNRAPRTPTRRPLLLSFSPRASEYGHAGSRNGVRWVSEASYCSFRAGERDLSFASILNIELVTNKPNESFFLTSTRRPPNNHKTPFRSPTSATRRSRSLRRDCR